MSNPNSLSARFATPDNTLVNVSFDTVTVIGVDPNGTADVSALLKTWLDAGNVPAPYVPPPAPTFLAQDMLAILSDADCAAIQSAIASSVSLWKLWQSLLGQRDPIDTSSDRFKQGWAGLKSVLGDARCGELATTLGIPNG
jgi:hypothetical protein